VLQIHLDSLTDAANADPDQFVPTKKMLSHGPGDVLVGPFRFPQSVAAPPGRSGVIQPVIVHAVLDKKGHVVEAEALQHSDSLLSDAALAIVARSNYARREGGRPCSAKPLSTCSSFRRNSGRSGLAGSHLSSRCYNPCFT